MLFQIITLTITFITLNFLIFYKLERISHFVNIFDKPDSKLKKHKLKTPLLGGIILILNILFFIFIYFFLINDFFQKNIPIRNLISIFLFTTSFFLIGLIDDKYNSKPENKFFTCIFFSLLCLLLNQNFLISDLRFSFYNNSIFLENFSYFFTIFCIVILVNALNFYDGINGQSIIYFIFIFCYLSFTSHFYLFYFFIILTLIFVLILNLSNKLFMGDNGIYFLGSIIILALIYEYKVFKSIEFADEIFLLLILPGYDLLRLTIIRLFNGKNPFYGDRNHIHHLLIKKFSIFKTNIILFLLSIAPILMFNFSNLNFFIIILLYTSIYIFIIYKL